jgi:uncharacterized protein
MKRHFDWDEEKAESNLRKHGIGFTLATKVFADDQALFEFDDYYGREDRWRTIGKVDGEILLLVVHTGWVDGDIEVIRIISARYADRRERLRYEENLRQIYN